MNFIFEGTGDFRFIFDDTLSEIAQEVGSVSVKRASHVEPAEADGKVNWYADMAPVGGPFLGPYKTRADALLAERTWLVERHIPKPR